MENSMKKEYPKKAIILAAGMGVRMEALTRDTPKCMAPIKGTTIIKNALEILRHKGVRKITLVCGYLESRLTNYCSNLGTGLDIEFLSNPDYQFTNNMYSLHIALSSLDEACWVIEGDVFFQKDFFDNFSPSSTEIGRAHV
jgi:choline kinase